MLLDEEGLTRGEKAAEQLAKLHPPAPSKCQHRSQQSYNIETGEDEEEGNFDGAGGGGDDGASPRRKHHVEVCDYCAQGSAARATTGMRLMFQNIRLSVKPTGSSDADSWLSRVTQLIGGVGPYDQLVNDASPIERPQTEKELLKGVSGRAQPGEILAIMGPSGAGKTSLIELLAGRKRPEECTAQGAVMINGREVDASNMWQFSSDTFNRKIKSDGSSSTKEGEDPISMDCSYVAQLNHHVGVLSVRETLEVAVALRLVLPNIDASAQDKAKTRSERVSLLIDMLGLKSIENVLVSSSSSGLSGGEAKRLSIAVEIVNLPSLIFLDEPTSGLDSMTAHEVSAAIRSLANQNRTIITTIHQPSVTTFCLFDNLLLLSDGCCAYYGPLRRAVPYFVGAGLNITYRRGLNPADFLVAVVSSTDPHDLALKYQDSDLYKVFMENMSTTTALDLTAANAMNSTALSPVTTPSHVTAENNTTSSMFQNMMKEFYRPMVILPHFLNKSKH
eukprot:CAMPEP_0114377474 /NCGR_PEP_ID=MMETSP0102-20121206/1025_1 /TAXON_ID=38822 ORGANISM="Pteridomonas danica, Strain PT" /NCGR_SAMPLE_ID=MMETSP0102 /ASSEMBLY_ACC=CAM_ASM_000212 /LENGTH=503 /DNA_ID=CAMNT_0001532071 /DNA_START=676 /DNA_END=2188 /DNA_ORIENTATION=+